MRRSTRKKCTRFSGSFLRYLPDFRSFKRFLNVLKDKLNLLGFLLGFLTILRDFSGFSLYDQSKLKQVNLRLVLAYNNSPRDYLL